jgi:hypothetical protein
VQHPGESAATAAIESCLAGAGGRWRRVAAGEWGLRAEVGGWPLDVGLALRSGLLRAQAEVLGAGQVDAHELLVRNRRLPLVRFAHSGAGAVWLVGELPAGAITEAEVDRLLGLVLQAADDLRARAAPQRSSGRRGAGQDQAASARRRA